VVYLVLGRRPMGTVGAPARAPVSAPAPSA